MGFLGVHPKKPSQKMVANTPCVLQLSLEIASASPWVGGWYGLGRSCITCPFQQVILTGVRGWVVGDGHPKQTKFALDRLC